MFLYLYIYVYVYIFIYIYASFYLYIYIFIEKQPIFIHRLELFFAHSGGGLSVCAMHSGFALEAMKSQGRICHTQILNWRGSGPMLSSVQAKRKFTNG